MHYKGVAKTLPEIARELKVDAIVEGSVSESDGLLRINLQLIHAGTDAHLLESWDHRLVILGPDGIVMDFLPAWDQQIHVRTATWTTRIVRLLGPVFFIVNFPQSLTL